MNRLIYNAIKTPDGTVLHSKHRHDYVDYTDKNGNYYAVDGGNDYLKRAANFRDYEELSKYDDGTHGTRREYIHWGRNYDKNMIRLSETEWIPIKDLETDHIKAILETQTHLDKYMLNVFRDELKYRESNVKNIR